MLTNRSPRKYVIISGLVGFVYLLFLITSSANKTKYDEMRRDIGDTVMAARKSKMVTERLGEILKCSDNDFEFERLQNGDYWVLKNYIRAGHGALRCHESITYTTHGDYTFLDNLVPLVTRWRAPISVTLFAPGSDFNATLTSIEYLRRCLPESELISKFITFHIFFPLNHMPNKIPPSHEDWLNNIKSYCDNMPPYLFGNSIDTYRQMKGLVYPINLARNVAKKAAVTHFVLASDMELYPSPGFVGKFMEMVSRDPDLADGLKVFPLAVFEIAKHVTMPTSKTELKELYSTNEVIGFHFHVCLHCHKLPELEAWIAADETETIGILTVTKRLGIYRAWEPFYVGRRSDPDFDERFTWEGRKDKMVQAFTMCLLDYDYHVLNDGFLIHRPGFKYHTVVNEKYVNQTAIMIEEEIVPQYEVLYGIKDGCIL